MAPSENEYEKFVGKFYGPRKIKAVSASDYADTPSGFKVVRVDYEGGYYEFIPTVSLELVATDEAKDFNYVRDTKFRTMLVKVLTVIADYDLQFFELDAFMSSVLKSLQDSFNRAMNWKWNKDDAKFIPGEDPVQFFSVLQANNVLKEVSAAAPAAPVSPEEKKDDGSETSKAE